jgi:hypothetical protein
MDPDPKVRQAVAVAVCEVAQEAPDTIPTELFSQVIERLKDKKVRLV